MEISLGRVKERVLPLSSDEHLKEKGGQVALSGRQMKIIEFIHANGSVKTSDLVAIFPISRQAALKELALMVKLGLLERQGIRRGALYVMK